jgi:hypothetical protein
MCVISEMFVALPLVVAEQIAFLPTKEIRMKCIKVKPRVLVLNCVVIYVIFV